MGAQTATMPTIQSSALMTYSDVGPPMVRARAASTTIDTGWFSAQPCSHDGIVATGTNADDANTSGARIGNDTACAVSASFTMRPTMANTHDNEYEKARMIPTAPIRPQTFVPIVQPTMKPTTHIRMTTKKFRTRSASVRPTSTAERAIGSDRNRSMSPLLRSSASPTPVVSEPNTIVCTKMPGIRKFTYVCPGGRLPWIAPPNT